MTNQQWFSQVYPYAFILQRYMDSIQNLNESFKENLPNLPDKLTDTQLEIFAGLLGTETIEGLYILGLLNGALDVDGHVCEYGVAQGATSTLLAHTIKDTDKHLYLFDSFEGLPKPAKEDGLKDDIFNLGSMDKYEGTMKCSMNDCISRLQRYGLTSDSIHIIPGFVNKTIDNSPDKVSFAFIDFDFYEPIKIVLEYLHDRLQPGGVFFVDDYDFFSTGVEKAVQEFLVDKNCYDVFIPSKHLGNFCILEKTHEC